MSEQHASGVDVEVEPIYAETAGIDIDAEQAPDGGADADDRTSPDGDPDDDGPARHDEQVDAEMDRLDDGGAVIGGTRGTAGSDALPFVLAAREHFAAVGDVEITGDARVDAATARLEEIPDLPTADHVAVYDDVHRRLQDALSDADVR